MGLADDLGYRHRRPNTFQRSQQRLASTRSGAFWFSRSLRQVDSVVQRATRGKHTVSSLVAGLPVLDLTTTGRKSGLPRTTHLISIPVGGDLAILGTNFGQPNTPAWVFNLEADPSATVHYRDASAAVTARPATDAERAEVMAQSASVYEGYQKYQQRITGRDVRIFVLEKTP
jgi:deazaflavin-dependent oxidoreductase (nitroreductase family)